MAYAYFDYSATTPLDPRVRAVLLEGLDHFHNAGASYGPALERRAALQTARERFAASIHADPREIVFTSGATEANNLALKGAVGHHEAKRPRIITLQTEHKAVLDPVGVLAKQGVATEFLPVAGDGRLDLNRLAEALRAAPTTLVSVMAVNNETGVLQDIPAIAALVHEHGAKLHVDGVQALGKMPVDVGAWNADMVSFSAHKIYGPVGIGALWVRRLPKMRLQAQQQGGGQERGLRSGTAPVALIQALAEAATLATAELAERTARVTVLNQRLRAQLPLSIRPNVDGHKIPHIENIALRIGAAKALALADRARLALSAGSACQSGGEGSHVLQAMNLPSAASSLRISLSHLTRDDELEQLLAFLHHL